MIQFPVHTPETAPADSVPQLEQIRKGLGFIPNLAGALAEAPAALEAYFSIGAVFDKTSFSPAERQVVLLSVSAENQCSYCVAAHTAIARMQKVPDVVVASIRNDERVPDAKLEALRKFTTTVVLKRGELNEAEVDEFIAAGFTRAQILEVLVGVAMKTLSNYVNHIAETPLDHAFAADEWFESALQSTAGAR